MATDAVAIVLAGGCGTRFGADMPKQFCPVNGRPVLWYVLARLNSHPDINRIVVVGNTNWMDVISDIAGGFPKLSRVVVGGENRGASIRAGLMAITDENARVMIIDGVRPFVSDDVISDGMARLNHADSVHTIMGATEDALVRGAFVDRGDISFISCPDFAWLNILRAGYLSPSPQNCVMQQIGPHVKVMEFIESNRDNIKITYPHDIYQMAQILGRTDK